FDGQLKSSDNVLFMANSIKSQIKEMGVFSPLMTPLDTLQAGDVGFIVTGIKDARAVRVGDTITLANDPVATPLPGYEDVEPMVYAGLYPRGSEFKDLKIGIEKLGLNDAAFQYEPEQSEALGMGFRGGFLGIFHLQIIRERLQEEFGLDVLTTMP
ncbi:elongation factor 4, partial [Pediococcus pentosaceus]|nr:elongation factor 4 [Pediococcus pentosaceus]